MKPVKNFLLAMLLMSAMGVSTIAGVQDTPGYVPPPPPERQMTTYQDTTDPETNTDEAGGITLETADYLLFEVLTALLSVY